MDLNLKLRFTSACGFILASIKTKVECCVCFKIVAANKLMKIWIQFGKLC